MVKNPPANSEERDLSLIPASGIRNSNPLQDSCLENAMDRGAWWATVYKVAKESDTTEATLHAI